MFFHNVLETLRKYPPVPSMMKVCIESTVLEIDGKSINIEAGTTVSRPIVLLRILIVNKDLDNIMYGIKQESWPQTRTYH